VVGRRGRAVAGGVGWTFLTVVEPLGVCGLLLRRCGGVFCFCFFERSLETALDG